MNGEMNKKRLCVGYIKKDVKKMFIDRGRISEEKKKEEIKKSIENGRDRRKNNNR